MASVVSKHDADSLTVRPPQASEQFSFVDSPGLTVCRLAPGEEKEFLSNLSAASLTNVIMAGLIRDNGFGNALNRGHFYACRGKEGKVEGIALIGHSILFEAFTLPAVKAFATVARAESSPQLVMGEREAVRRFFQYYAQQERSLRHQCPILFLRTCGPFPQFEQPPDLRLATPEDLECVVLAHAQMALETSGVDPLKKDPAGFRERYLRRIAQKRVWVLVRNSTLIFKTDVIAETPDATYVEGVYVSPEHRGRGLGSRCVSELGRILLRRSKAIYLFVENQNPTTQSFYLKLGFEIAGQYDLLYF